MRFASVAEIKDGLSAYLARAKLEWKQLARRRLTRAWEGEEDALYDYL